MKCSESILPLSGYKILMLLDNPLISDARVEKEMRTLSNAGASVIVACTQHIGQPPVEFRYNCQINRIIPSGFDSPLKNDYRKLLLKIVCSLEQLDFNCVHCHDFYMLELGALLKKRKPELVLIYDAHEYLRGWPFFLTAEKRINRFKGRIVWNYLNYREKLNIKKADKVVTITQEIAHLLQKDNQLPEIPYVIGNYPEKIDLVPDKQYFHKFFGLAADVKILIHTGSIYHSPIQIDALVETIISTENVALVFIGNRERFFELKEKYEGSPKHNRKIFFHPYPKSQEEVIKLLSCAHIGLFHVRNKWVAHVNGFANRFVEYLMAEIPVIGTPQRFAVGLNKKFNCAEFYDENSKEELKHCLDLLISNINSYTKSAIAAKRSICWETESVKLINLYASVNV